MIADRVLRALVPDPTRLGKVTSRDIRLATGLCKDQVCGAMPGLLARGLVRRCRVGVYAITPAGLRHLEGNKTTTFGPKGPRPIFAPSSFRARLWRALRLKRVATVDELLVLAAKGTEGNAREDANKYLRALARAGILDPAYTRSGPQRWLLLRDTGPRAPQWNKRQKRVFDPNTETTYDLQEATHDLA